MIISRGTRRNSAEQKKIIRDTSPLLSLSLFHPPTSASPLFYLFSSSSPSITPSPFLSPLYHAIPNLPYVHSSPPTLIFTDGSSQFPPIPTPALPSLSYPFLLPPSTLFSFELSLSSPYFPITQSPFLKSPLSSPFSLPHFLFLFDSSSSISPLSSPPSSLLPLPPSCLLTFLSDFRENNKCA